MNETKQGYNWIDNFRIIAVILVIAIHTSPLVSINETADFILTRVLARTAVPFFFMATGFFLLPGLVTLSTKETTDNAALLRFLKKIVILYGFSIIIYLPLNIYSGFFGLRTTVFSLFKALVFDGTLYHLWYFPAVTSGVLIVYLFAKKLPEKALGVMVLILYLLGLLGDSYFGITVQIPFIKIFYDNMFVLFDYTRNGLFFAPVFLVMGGWIACGKKTIGVRKSIMGLIFSLSLMIVEAMILNHYDLQRHDSMYVMLLPCMYFLFQLILSVPGESRKNLRTLSMLVYILHPLCIVLVRGFAKMTGWTPVLIENSFTHFVAVTAASFALCIILQRISGWRKEKPYSRGRAWQEINLSNLISNVKSFQGILPESCSIMAVVKANAYGHGDIAVSKALYQQGIRAFAVSTVTEGISLRQHGIGGDILIMGCTGFQDLHLLTRYRLIQTVVDCEYAGLLNSYGKKIKVHIKIDTGMNRLGENCHRLHQIAQMYHIKI
ncbi:alanine racemase [Candidatus Contubernalis alkaliaceticus]|uniref:alanine racemase n=1 Tax=Candidatus Contubernalis alkaliaceticus TaxID=338645 RepID=UPI00240A8EBB|nr:alanine racemase [Candidatus Contubernalis alkalaceticus]